MEHDRAPFRWQALRCGTGRPDCGKPSCRSGAIFAKNVQLFPIETRGSNLAGGLRILPPVPLRSATFIGTASAWWLPPNSPWAAHRRRLRPGDCRLSFAHRGAPARRCLFPFRFYTHDPWWLNSPWLDRYGREPHDIYLPLALARVNGDAQITPPAYFEFLTIDNSYGRMPDQVPNEVIPHVLIGDGRLLGFPRAGHVDLSRSMSTAT